MRKLLTSAALFMVIIAMSYFTACNNDSKPGSTTTTSKEDSLKNVIEKGKYLTINVAGCMDCHSTRDFTKFSGPVVPGTEGGGGFAFDEKVGIPGVVYGKNITPDTETGIGSWTDDDIIRALTQGINKKGDTLFPIMPYPHFNHSTKEDLMSIIAYLRTLKPIKNKIPDRKLMMPIAMAYPGPALQPSIESNVRPVETDVVKYGEYLVNMADCGTCHSPLTQMGPDMSRMFQGGYTFDIGSNKVTSANITPDSATGIGTWTEAMFLAKFKNNASDANINRNPGKENSVMPWSFFGKMKDDDLKAIYAYLRTVKPATNKIEKFPK